MIKNEYIRKKVGVALTMKRRLNPVLGGFGLCEKNMWNSQFPTKVSRLDG